MNENLKEVLKLIEKETIETEEDKEQEIDGWDAICDRCDYYYDLENFG